MNEQNQENQELAHDILVDKPADVHFLKGEKSLLARFLRNAEMNYATGCWIWKGKLKYGYGRIHFGGRKGESKLAHKIAYEMLIGPVPTGLELDHLCRQRSCCNPEHLEPVTHAENCRRGISSLITKARHKAKTHCKFGHEFTEQNTYRRLRGRACYTCRKTQAKIYKARVKLCPK